MSEYKIERDKKQSFETRAGIIMALLGATCGIFFKTIKLNNIIHLFFPNTIVQMSCNDLPYKKPNRHLNISAF